MIKPISAQETRPLRQRLLRPTQQIDQLIYDGDDASDSLHLGAFDGDAHIGIASVFQQAPPSECDAPAWRLRGMAVVPDARGRGIGGKLTLACIAHAARHGGKIIWCTARTSAADFYLRYGFEVRGEPFELGAFGPHYYMFRALTVIDSNVVPVPMGGD